MLGWREVYMSSVMNDCVKVRDVLDREGIRYRYKIRNAYGDNLRRMGSFGVDMNYAFQYYLFVKRQNFEQAQRFIESARREGGA